MTDPDGGDASAGGDRTDGDPPVSGSRDEALPVDTPPGSASIAALRATADATLTQRIVLDDGRLESSGGAGPWWGVGALVRRTDGDGERTLWVRPDGYQGWVTPGGTVEPGESLRAAAEREVREETGVGATIGAPLALVAQAFVPSEGADPGRAVPGGFVLFEARVAGDPSPASPAALGEDGETIHDVRWFAPHPPASALDPLAGDVLSALGLVEGSTGLTGDRCG